MKKFTNGKKLILLGVLLLVLLTSVVAALIFGNSAKAGSFFTLNERDVLMEIGDSKKLELEFEDTKINKSDCTVTWESSKSSVATVDEDGTVDAVAGGETKVTAIVEYKGKQYSSKCVVTVKAEGNEYSTYKVRWYTQKQDRSGYDIKEETFERLVGSTAEMTLQDAKKQLPANYTFNKEKSILTGTVKEAFGACVLEVYFDVAEITYSVDYYYESAEKLGTYDKVETKKYTTWAFSKAEVTDGPKTGFVINEAVKGTVKSSDSVVAGSKLKVYCDRIRSKVTVTYVSGKASATYDCIYGIGLINAPEDVFSDSAEYKLATFVNGKWKEATADLMKTLTSDTEVAVKLDGKGFAYTLENGTSVITNKSSAKQTPSYAVLKGASDTIYLSATYTTTGSSSNTFGINLSDGKTTRQIRFSGTGIAVMKNNTTTGGVDTAKDTTNAYASAGVYNDGDVYVWAQNTKGYGSTKANSVIQNMLRNTAGGSYDIHWAVLDNVLYASIDGETVLRLPLKYLDKSWTGNKKYQIGFSAYDANAWGDALKISNINLKFGKDAKDLLVAEDSFDSSLSHRMGYDALTGAYMPSSNAEAAYMYGKETSEDTGISAKIEWADVNNTCSAVGITVKIGEKSHQYLVQGENTVVRHLENHTWENTAAITALVVNEGAPFSRDGKAEVKAFVKGDYLHVMYNGVQVQCINMISLFPEYTRDSEVAVGLYSWDARYGLAKFSDIKELNASEISSIANADEWGYYSESLTVNSYSFPEASITKTTSGWKRLYLYGSDETWQIEGTMNRLDEGEQRTRNLLMGFEISSGDDNILILGYRNGFKKIAHGNWNDATLDNNNDMNMDENGNREVYKSTLCSFNNIVSTEFFNSGGGITTQNSIDYKAVLYNDTLYVWFKDEAGNEGLCWRIPLTDEEFGGFEKGSDYKVNLCFADTDTKASMTNLDVKMGYQVTEQTDFVEDNKGTQYDFCEGIEKIEANIAKWQDTFRAKALSGMMAEELCTTSTVIKSQAYAYLAGSDDDIYLSATHEIAEETTSQFFGISLMSDDGEERAILYNRKGVRIFQERAWLWEDVPALKDKASEYYTTAINGYVWTQNGTSTLDNMLGNLSDTHEYITEWAITDGVIYGMVDDFVFFRMPLNEICADWNKDTELQIGFAHWDIADNGAVKTIKDIEVSFGDEALAKMVKDKEVEHASNWGMVYEVFTGHYMPWAESGGAKYIYGSETTDTQMMKATISFVDKNVVSSAGITVRSGSGESAQIVVQGNNNKVRLMFSQSWNDNNISAWCHAEPFDAEGLCQATAIVKNDTLYIYYNDKLAGSVDLYKILDGYKADGENEDKVQLGIYSWDGNGGLSLFTDIAFKAGKDAEEYITANNIASDDSKEWEIFTTDANGTAKGTAIVNDGTGNVAGTNMTSNGKTHVSTPTSTAATPAYVYGVATSMPQKLTVDLKLADVTKTVYANGISVAYGTESVEFYVMSENKEYIRVQRNKDKAWDGRQYYTFQNAKTMYDENSVCNITAIVKDGMLYLQLGNEVAYKVQLSVLFPSYATDGKVKLGVSTYRPSDGGLEYSNMQFQAGSGIAIDQQTTYETIYYFIYKESALAEGFDRKVYDNGIIMKSASNDDAYMCFDGTSDVWEVTGTMKRTDTSYNSGLKIGFNIEQDKWMYVMGAASGISFRYNGCGNSWNTSFASASNKYVLKNPTNTAMFSENWSAASDKDIEFKAVIYEEVLYVWLDGEPVWRVKLTDKIDTTDNKVTFAGMTPNKPFKFGLVVDKFSTNQTAQFENLTVKMNDADGSIKEAVEAFETVYKAANP